MARCGYLWGHHGGHVTACHRGRALPGRGQVGRSDRGNCDHHHHLTPPGSTEGDLHSRLREAGLRGSNSATRISPFRFVGGRRYRSISPKTISREPRTADMSASMGPLHRKSIA
jgi:hypothetical protein